jgi:hypothetical protein
LMIEWATRSVACSCLPIGDCIFETFSWHHDPRVTRGRACFLNSSALRQKSNFLSCQGRLWSKMVWQGKCGVAHPAVRHENQLRLQRIYLFPAKRQPILGMQAVGSTTDFRHWRWIIRSHGST